MPALEDEQIQDELLAWEARTRRELVICMGHVITSPDCRGMRRHFGDEIEALARDLIRIAEDIKVSLRNDESAEQGG